MKPPAVQPIKPASRTDTWNSRAFWEIADGDGGEATFLTCADAPAEAMKKQTDMARRQKQ
jgi:hypothetical protein